MLKQIAKKLCDGFVFGVGFMVAAFLIVQASDAYKENERRDHHPEKIRYQETDALIFSNSEVVRESKVFSIAGDLTNRTPYEWHDITLNADVFKGKKLIHQSCNSYVLSTIKPAETMSFVVVCDYLNNTDGLDFKLSIGGGSRYATAN